MRIGFGLVCFVLGILHGISGIAQSADAICGLWTPADGTSHVEIYAEDNMYFGKIVWMKTLNDENGKPRRDKNGDALMNMVILKDFVFDDGAWEGGTVYDPRTGKTYYCTMELVDGDKLKIRGSIDPMGWLGRTETWVRRKN